MTLQDIIDAIEARGAFIDPGACPEDRTQEAIACLKHAQEALKEKAIHTDDEEGGWQLCETCGEMYDKECAACTTKVKCPLCMKMVEGPLDEVTGWCAACMGLDNEEDEL